ncbi:MAG: alanine racemase [Clostridiales bacterium]|nr:alanine racemase [Clostridiales bacterium]
MREFERTWVEVDLDAIADNIRVIKDKVGEKTAVMAVIKADGYGHGADVVAPVLLENGADMFGVSILEEAVPIRALGIDAPILVLGFTPPARFAEIARRDIEQTIYDFDMARKLSDAAGAEGVSAKIHIKIETGMSRLGFYTDEKSVKEIKSIQNLPNIQISGAYTHLADVDDAAFTYAQAEKFKAFIDELDSRGVEVPAKHVSNSGAIMNYHDLNMDIVRAGIALYGLSPSPFHKPSGLKRAMSMKSQVSYVKEVPKDTPIGYGRAYCARRDSVIATVPVGYADGYSRALSNKGYALVRNRRAPIVGRVCMDQFMLDVTDAPDVEIYDEVTLIGRQGGLEITADELAEVCDTINYEIVCMVSKRVPRVYVRGGENRGEGQRL